MSDKVTVYIDGRPVTVPAGTLVVSALAMAGRLSLRRSVSGQNRGPFCGIGVCFECRVRINGQGGCRSCKAVCEEGMEIVTDG